MASNSQATPALAPKRSSRLIGRFSLPQNSFASYLCLFVATFCLLSCVTPEAEMTPWIGHDSTSLIGQWGPPQYKTSDNKGGEIWIYQQQRSFSTPAYASSQRQTTAQGYGTVDYNTYGSATYRGSYNAQSYSNTSYTPSRSYVRTQNRSFYIDQNGRIYAVRWGGN